MKQILLSRFKEASVHNKKEPIKGISKVFGSNNSEIALFLKDSFSLQIFDYQEEKSNSKLSKITFFFNHFTTNKNKNKKQGFLFGHTGKIIKINSSSTLPFLSSKSLFFFFISNNILFDNLQVTGSEDKTAKVWDCRANSSQSCLVTLGMNDRVCAVQIASVNSIPFTFSSTLREPVVKVWDLRMNKCLYELSTGANLVDDIFWNEKTNSLLVSTKCQPKFSFVERSENYFEDNWKANEDCVIRFKFSKDFLKGKDFLNHSNFKKRKFSKQGNEYF